MNFRSLNSTNVKRANGHGKKKETMVNGELEWSKRSVKLSSTLLSPTSSSSRSFLGSITGNYHGNGHLMRYQGQLKWPNIWSSSLYAKTSFSTVCTDSFTASPSTKFATNNITNLLSMLRLQLNMPTHLSTFVLEILLGYLGHCFWEARYMSGQLIFGAFWDICSHMKVTVGMNFHGVCGALFHSSPMQPTTISIIQPMLATSLALWSSGTLYSTPTLIIISMTKIRNRLNNLQIKRKLNENILIMKNIFII